jgi:hypothetical protein
VPSPPWPQDAATPLDSAAIREAVAAVFSHPAYNPPEDRPWWAFLGEWARDALAWLRALLEPAREAARTSPRLYWVVVTTAVVLLGILLAWWGYLAYTRHVEVAGPGRRRGGRAGPAGDQWAATQRLAAEGRYTEAAHALYRALLEAGARRGELRLHPSKTAGDYVRELRARSSAMLGRFRDFARSYDVVIYGSGVCDRERFERLAALALPILRPHG